MLKTLEPESSIDCEGSGLCRGGVVESLTKVVPYMLISPGVHCVDLMPL